MSRRRKVKRGAVGAAVGPVESDGGAVSPYPSLRVLYGSHRGEWPAHGNQEYVPQFERALSIEKDLVDDGFCVAYHLIPGGAMNGAILIYEANAVLAELLYGVDHFQILPRFNPEDFMEWPDVQTMLPQWKNNDHDPRWRKVGIACSPSLFSNTEAPPYSMFSFGYGASNPDVAGILASTLECFTSTKAKTLGSQFAEEGKKLFANVGGSMLQIFVHRSMASKYMFLSHAMGVLVSHSEGMLKTLDRGDLSTIQIRLIANPEVFINEKHGRVYQYHSKEEEYIMAKTAFREFIIKRLVDSAVAMPYLSINGVIKQPRLAQLKRDNSTLRQLDSAQIQLTEEDLALNMRMFEREASAPAGATLKKENSTLRELNSAELGITDEELALNLKFFDQRGAPTETKKAPREEKEEDLDEESPPKKRPRLEKDNSTLRAAFSAQVDFTEEDIALNLRYFEKKDIYMKDVVNDVTLPEDLLVKDPVKRKLTPRPSILLDLVDEKGEGEAINRGRRPSISIDLVDDEESADYDFDLARL